LSKGQDVFGPFQVFLMKILLTNDDGIHAEGLWVLHEKLNVRHAVTVVAPDRERSAVGHGITLHQPLRTARVQVNGGGMGYAVEGTPVDCVKIGLMEILDEKPDMVISGINPGANVGVNINYSGTVAAAKEAALYKVPAIAVSIQGRTDDAYDFAASFTRSLAEHVYKKGLPFGTFLNVNVPDIPGNTVAGVRISRQGTTLYKEYVEKRIDPRNRTYYWHGHDAQTSFDNPDIDCSALDENFITITPIKCDTTDYDMLEELKQWDIHKMSF
jgi:5'-nucleotidase